MECPKCGFEIENNHTICRGCGESVLNLTKLANNNITTTIPSKMENHIITNEERAEIRQILEKEKMNTKNEVSLPSKEEKNNTFCKNCGCAIEKEWNFCPNCKKTLTEYTKTLEEVYIPTSQEKRFVNIFSKCAIVGIILQVVIGLIAFFTEHTMLWVFVISPLPFLVAFITILVAKLKYPKNNTIKNLFKGVITYGIIIFLASAVFYAWLMISCLYACTSAG